MKKEEFLKLAEQKMVLDGATGSCLYKMGMPRGICSELWILEHSEVMTELQRGYVDAGSQVVLAPTFGGNRAALESYGLGNRIEEMNQRLVEISQQAVEGRAYVGGDVTAAAKMIGSSSEATYDRAVERYQEQIRYLHKAGVDLLIGETMTSIQEAMAFLEAAQSECSLPVLCSMTIEADGSIYGGGNIFEAVEVLQGMGADAVGINCSVGPDQLVSVVAGMKENQTIPLIVKPNAGMPMISEQGEAVYSMNPEQFAQHMEVLLERGADIVGGCCGTTPDYIRELCRKLR